MAGLALARLAPAILPALTPRRMAGSTPGHDRKSEPRRWPYLCPAMTEKRAATDGHWFGPLAVVGTASLRAARLMQWAANDLPWQRIRQLAIVQQHGAVD